MAFEITASAGVLMLRAHGAGTAVEGHRAFQDVQAHASYYLGVPILIDALDLEYTPSTAEARVFAGLFATAFPYSLLAILARPGEFHQAALDITELSVNRGAIVAAFSDRHEALAWVTGGGNAEVSAVEFGTLPSIPGAQRVLDGVVIPYTLREKIETTLLDVNGHDCPLHLDSAAGRPVFEPDVAEVTVSTEFGGAARRATVDVRVSSLDDEDYVVSAVVDAMRAVLAGAQMQLRVTASSAAPR
jgi:hypothetical protein